jgi:hypothetical protein
MITETLCGAFTLANRRLRLVFFDMLWKSVWLAVTMGMLLASFVWFADRVQSIGWESTGVPGLDDLVAGSLLRQIWQAYSGTYFMMLCGVVVLSAGLWLILEAFVRSRIVENGSFGVFLASHFFTLAVLGSAALFFASIAFGPYVQTPWSQWRDLWVDTRGALLVSAIVLGLLTFAGSALETLIRTDAVPLLGKDLFGVAGVIGTLAGFEAMIGSAAFIGILATLLNASGMDEIAVVALLAGAVIVFLSLLHSYLLVVRFFAVGIMRHDAVDI